MATFGDVIVDYYLLVEDSFLNLISGEKGGSQLIDSKTFSDILKHSPQMPKKSAGGSAMNMIKGLARLGHACVAIGYIGNDDNGRFFTESLKEHGVHCHFIERESPTACCISLITPDCQRTMRTFLGEMGKTLPIAYHAPLLKGVKHLHIEGYQIFKPQMLEEIASLAKQEGASLSIDLGSFELASHFRAEFLNFIEHHATILFANQDEAKTLTGLPAYEAAAFLSTLCDIAVVTMSKEGGYVASKEGVFLYRACPAKLRDETGAGDFFVSGFLHGYLTGTSLLEAAQLGAELAARIVEHVGTDLSAPVWEEINFVSNHR